MRRRWRRSICGFATFSPWGEPKLRVGGCPQPAPVRAGGLREAARGLRLAPVWAGGLRQAAWGLQLVPVRAGGLRQAARGLQLAPVRAGGLRESQWECASSGEAHSGSGSSREGQARGLGFAAGPSGPETSGGAGVRDWGAQPVGRRAIPERLLLACPV